MCVCLYYNIYQILITFRFDTEKQIWQSCEPLPFGPNKYTAVELNGMIYVAWFSDFYRYDTPKDLLSKIEAAGTAGTPSFAKSNELIYAIESNWTIHQYDAIQNEWTTVIEIIENVQIQILKIQIYVFRLGGSATLEQLKGFSAIAIKFTYFI